MKWFLQSGNAYSWLLSRASCLKQKHFKRVFQDRGNKDNTSDTLLIKHQHVLKFTHLELAE